MEKTANMESEDNSQLQSMIAPCPWQIDFSSKKKKRRDKSARFVNEMTKAIPGKVVNDGAETINDCHGDYKDNLDETLPGYDQLWNRIFDKIRVARKLDPEWEKRKKLTIPVPLVLKASRRQIAFVNFIQTTKSLHRSPKHLMSFIAAETGTSCALDGSNKLLVKGTLKSHHFMNILRNYAYEYVTCGACQSADTFILKEGKLTFLQCDTCENRKSVEPVRQGYRAVVRMYNPSQR